MDSITGSVLHIGSALPNLGKLGCSNYVDTNYLVRPCVKGYKKLTAENWRCQVSGVTCQFYFYFFIFQSGGASRWMVCYQRGLPRLV